MKDEDEDNTEDIKTHTDKPFLISYYSHKINWSNTRVIKASYPRLLVLTDDGKVKYRLKYYNKYNNNN